MQRIVFKGRVTPTIHTISIPAYSLTIEDANLKTVINTEVTNNDVTVTVGVEKYDPATIGDLARRAIRIVRAATDLVSFATGKGLNFSLEDVTLPDGKSGSPDFDYANARKLCTSYQLKTFASVLPIALEQDVSMALSDLTDTLTQPDRCAVNCGRVVETLRAVIDRNPDREKAWATMQTQLNLSKSYLKLITDNAQSHRHGDYLEIDAKVGEDIRDRTWTIMNRFFEYRKRGDKQLPVADFPVLG